MDTRRTPAAEPAIANSAAANVTVLLSTFNGAAFLQEQLDSLYAQTYPHVSIVARDDGSSDSTPEILERARAAGRIEIMAGSSNLGAGMSFFALLSETVAAGAMYFAFCDQDDVWLPDKIERAVSALSRRPTGEAAMYCSRLELVDASLNHLGLTPLPRLPGFGNALVENIAVGCTTVLNRSAAELLVSRLPKNVLIHDWWCYAVVSCFGKIVFDAAPSIRYRQHGGNTFGASANGRDEWLRKVRRFSGNSAGLHWQSDQAATLLATHGADMPAAHRQLVDRFVGGRSSFAQRIVLALSRASWRQKWLDDIAQRVLILLNRY